MNPVLKQRRVGVTKIALSGIEVADAGTAEVLPIDALIVDPDYQRGLRHGFVNEIARDYDIVKAGPILVSKRGNHLYVVDGQHRLAGAQQAGETEIFAHVVHGLTQEQEAELRLARNHRKSDTTFEKFRTRLIMQDPIAHAMVEIAHQHGTQINTEANVHRGINSIAGAEQLYRAGEGGGVWLNRVLNFLGEAFDGDLHGRHVSMAMMKSTAWFIDRHFARGEAKAHEMARRLNRVGVDDLDRKARSHQAALGGSLWLNYYRALVEVWNFRRNDENKLQWQTQGGIAALGERSAPPPASAQQRGQRSD